MKEQVFKWVVKRPFIVILGLLVLVMAATYGGSKLTFESDYRVFFSDENPQLTAFEKVQATFTKNDSVAFVVAPKDGVVFSEKTLTAIHALTTESWQIPYASRVDSVTNYQHTRVDGDDLVVADLVLEPELLPELDLEEIKQITLREPVLLKKLIADDASVSVVNVTVQLPGLDPATELPEVVTKVREIRSQILTAYPDIDIYLSGIVIMNNTFSEAALSDSATLIPLMFGVVALVMMLLLRSISGSIATIIVVMCSIMATMGLVGWLGFYITGPSASAPTVIMTLAVADCIHILATMLYEMRHGKTKNDAILESLRVNFQPVLLTSVTTAIGFLSMNFSDSPPFRDLGNFVAIGVMLAFLFSITLFPALLRLLPIRIKVAKGESSDYMSVLGDFVVKQRRKLLPAFSLIIVAIVLFLPQNELNDDFVKYFDQTVPFRQATDFMQENLSGLTTQEIELNSKESGGVNSPEYLKVLADFSDWVREQPETENVSILSDVLRRLNQNMHADDPSYYRFPEDRELAAQYLLLYELSLPYGLDLNNQLDVDKASSRIVVTTKNITSTENIAMEERIGQWFAENAPNYSASIVSPTLMFAHIGQRNIYSMLVGTSVALLLISLVLGFALRSVKFGFISLLPNLIPAAMGFGIWFFVDGQIGLGLSVVAGMTLGIVVDDTVHFLSKYLRARREKNKNSVEAVQYAFNSVGRALLVTTLVLFAGFMVLAQSSFKLNADMGLLTAITIVLALIIDFFFLPPLLMLLDKDKTVDQVSTLSGETNYVSDKAA
jgi:predicted RND superfamily exporter protein